jgi:hypothetical protein
LDGGSYTDCYTVLTEKISTISTTPPTVLCSLSSPHTIILLLAVRHSSFIPICAGNAGMEIVMSEYFTSRRSLADIKASVDKKGQSKQDIIPNDGYYEHINNQHNDMEFLVYQAMNSEDER